MPDASEMRLIDANAACERCRMKNSGNCGCCIVGTAPTVDAKIVKQGCWEEYMPYVKENPNNTTVKRRCSICKSPASPFMTYFCQNCGAQLRRDIPHE